jgi:hypothetical protein
MADVTKEVKKAGKKAARLTATSSVSRSKDVGRNSRCIGKPPKAPAGSGRQPRAADEFGKGFREGVDQALGKSGGGGASPTPSGKPPKVAAAVD